MSARFLAQLAHRAVAAPDVRPRLAARFEPAAAAELAVERITDAPVAASERAAPPRAQIDVATHAPLEVPREPSDAPSRIVTRVERTEHIERTIHREIAPPELVTAPAPRTSPAARADAPPAPAPSRPALASTSPPVHSPPSPPASASMETHAKVATTHAAPTGAPLPARGAPTPAAPLLVTPTLSPPAVHVQSTEAAARREPAPAALAPIEIVIGRIEIRGDAPSAPASARTPAPARRTAPSLDDYLRGREGAGG